MFTGIVTDIGKIVSVEKTGDTRVVIECRYDADDIDIGASIACSGVCLTVTDRSSTDDGLCRFGVDASAETLAKTTLGAWKEGSRINLERSLRLGDEMGGHLVSGHVDGVAEILSIAPEGDSMRFRFRAPDELAPYVARKGSVALDGTSLTVNDVEGSEFGVNIIPHTLDVTTWGLARAGSEVNIEIDLLARYVERLGQMRAF